MTNKPDPYLTEKLIRKLLHYNKLTDVFTWKVKLNRGGKSGIGKIAGGLSGDGYIQIGINKRIYRAHRIAWIYMTGAWPKKEIDHINGIRTDNRWRNLREATVSQNRANSKLSKRNSCGVKGIYWNKEKSKWQAQITINSKVTYLGRHDDKTKAASLYITAAKKHFGKYANPIGK